MLPKFFKKQSGMGLVEVMVAASILGGLSLVVMKLNETGIQGVTRTEKGMEIVEFDAEINSYFASKEGCTNSVAGTPLLTSFDSTGEQYAIPSVRDRINVVKFTPGVAGDVRRNVRFRSAYLTAYNMATPAGPGAGNAFLVKTYEFKLSPEKTVTKSKQITVAITPDTATGTMLSECIIKATKSDSVWTVDTYGIYYSSGTVAIGKTAAVQVPLALDVSGQSQLGSTTNSISGTIPAGNSIFGGINNAILGTVVSNSNIYGGTNNGIISGFTNAMAGGRLSTIDATLAGMFNAHSATMAGNASSFSVIVGGDSSNIWGNSERADLGGSNAIVAGQGIAMSEASNSFVGGGTSNSLTGTRASAMLGGEYNQISTTTAANKDNAVMLGGSFNGIYNANLGVILGGNNNSVGGDFGVIVGGLQNAATTFHSVIVGGINNTVTNWYSSIFGSRLSAVSGQYSAVLGGYANTVQGTYNTAEAGYGNYFQDSSTAFSSIVGGAVNTISWGSYSFIGGGYQNNLTSFYGVILGGQANTVAGNNSGVLGGYWNIAAYDNTFVMGGAGNNAGAYRGAIIGGANNTLIGNGVWADNGIFTGQNNKIDGYSNAIISGNSNYILGYGNTILSGSGNTITGFGLNYATIMGGQNNLITGGSSSTTSSITGGYENQINSSSISAILGGYRNTIISAYDSAVIGGAANRLWGSHSVILGGYNGSVGLAGGVTGYSSGIFAGEANRLDGAANIIIGGTSNMIETGWRNAILGGTLNSISGMQASNAIVGGGYHRLIAGDYTVAMGGSYNTINAWSAVTIGGRYMGAVNTGAVMIGDYNSSTPITSTANDQMTMRFSGGYRICSNSACGTGVTMAAGVSGWTNISSKAKKEDFEFVDKEKLLTSISMLDIPTWMYKDKDAKKKRYIGPFAEEFYKYILKPFGITGDDKTINQMDLMGVTLAGVQGLEKRTVDLKEENKKLKERVRNLESEMKLIHARLDELSKK